MTRHDLTTQIFYKSLFEAAERFYEKDPATALEIYRSYFRYAFGETEDIETDNEVAELLVRQNAPNLDISTEKYLTACDQGPKGKESGGGIGRPRKGETKEEYQQRVQEWKTQKPLKGDNDTVDLNNPEKPLKGDSNDIEIPENPVIEKSALQVSQNPEKPLTYTYASSLTNSSSKENTSIDKENNKEIDKYKNLTFEEYLKMFINRNPDLNYNLSPDIFRMNYTSKLDSFKNFIETNTGVKIEDINLLIQYLIYYRETGVVPIGE